MTGGYRVGNRGPRTPGVGEVFPYQDWLDNVNNGEAPRMSGVGGLLSHIVSTVDGPQVRSVSMGGVLPQQMRLL